MKRVVFQKKAYQRITKAVIQTDNQYEVGGVLLGYKICGCYIIADATTPENSNGQSKTTFILEGEYHALQAETLAKSFRYTPTVMGIWHSHICDGLVFSTQDEISNKQFAHIYKDAVSVLVIMQSKKFLWRSYHLALDGKAYLCKTKMR